MNIIAVTGNLCKEINVTYTKTNKAVIENTIAVSRDRKKEDGTRESDFINFLAFESKANYLKQYAKKGDKIEIVGRLRADSWKDDKDNYHTKTYIVVDSIKILTSRIKEINTEEVPF